MKKESVIQLFFGIFVAVDVVYCKGIQTIKSLHRGAGEGYAIFREHPFSKLNVTPSFSEAVKTYKRCIRDCVANPNCSSANFGRKEVLKGVFLCELLPKDIYNASSSFVSPSQDFFHYSIKTPCSDLPCKNGGTCIPNYYEDTYKCNCVRKSAIIDGNCEEVPLEQSAILNHTNGHTALQQLKSYLSSVKTGVGWRRCWWATHDGWDVEKTFHPLCDGKGPTVTLLRKDGYVYGGYADKSWESLYRKVSSTKAFLFSLVNINGYQPSRFNVVNFPNAFHHVNNVGPLFGYSGYDMKVGNNAATTASSYIYLSDYSRPSSCPFSGYCNFFNGISGKYNLSDIEVFYEIF